jgi:hypothetical protein
MPSAPLNVDINVNSISPNEFIAGGPSGSSSSGSASTGDLAQGSSFDPDMGENSKVVAVGQTVTLGGGGSGNTPPPPIVQAMLTQILGAGPLDTLSTALSSVSTADDQGAAASAGESTPGTPNQASNPSGPAQTGIPAGGAAANPSVSGPAGPVAVVAPGQTITLAGGKAGNLPPPAAVQASFDQGFTSQARATLTSAALSAVTSANPSGPNTPGAVAVVAPGQTVTLSGGKSANSPPPAPVQAAFDQGFSPESRATLSQAAGQ